MAMRRRRILALIFIAAIVTQVIVFPGTDYFFPAAEEPIPYELGGM